MLIIDSCSDLTAEIVASLDVYELHFPFTIAGQDREDDFGRTFPHRSFYDAMRAGGEPTTAQIPRAALLEAFRSAAREGRTAIYLGFTSGLSGTFDSAYLIREAVLEEFPDADIRVLDTLSASIAEGLVVYEAARMLAEGASADELVAWAETARMRANGYFTLDNLESLKRGGRISDAAAVAGAMLDIKPILLLDREGKLSLKRSVRGRKKSLSALIDIMAERIELPVGTVIVGHADAPEDAEKVRAMVEERFSPSEVLFLEIGPVIGAHVGPGMVAVSFWGDER